MKLKDIKIGQDVAARVKRYPHSDSATQRCRVIESNGRHVMLYVYEWAEARLVYFSVIDSTWAAHEAATAKAEAKREAARARERAAWEAKRAEERERFEQHILPAFKGLPSSSRDDDLAEYIAEMMLDGGSTTVQFREADLRAIADRVIELSNVIAQTALTADDLPQAGWGVTDEQRAAQEVAAAKDAHARAGGDAAPTEERVVIDIPFERLGLDIKAGDA